ncbi:MAG: hypothetical protein EBT93_00360 [Alphaproteobacteria bacterium]|nr:hypothetical protein [Alphaproteobacteria bacterium]
MSVPRPDPILSLKKRLHEGSLHHGILLLGNNISGTEKAALVLTQVLLSMDEEDSAHPDLFHLRPSGKARKPFAGTPASTITSSTIRGPFRDRANEPDGNSRNHLSPS